MFLFCLLFSLTISEVLNNTKAAFELKNLGAIFWCILLATKALIKL